MFCHHSCTRNKLGFCKVKLTSVYFCLSECHEIKTSPVRNYMFKVNNKNTTPRCEICSKLTIKTPERRQL